MDLQQDDDQEDSQREASRSQILLLIVRIGKSWNTHTAIHGQ